MLRIILFLVSPEVELKLEKKHWVSVAEIESVGRNDPIFVRDRDLYSMLGRTDDGRYLFVFVRYLGRNTARVITAHEMTDREKDAFRRLKG